MGQLAHAVAGRCRQVHGARTGDELFFLTEGPGLPPLCPPLELDAFVAFVNGLGPQKARRVSKLDVAFEKQLTKKP